MFNMFDLEEYIKDFSKLLNITICCNRKTGSVAEDTTGSKDTFKRKRKVCDASDLRQARNVRFCELPVNANASASSASSSIDDVDIDIDIEDNIVKIKEELENNMSFRYQSESLRIPRIPVR
jgi:hypothetical protein